MPSMMLLKGLPPVLILFPAPFSVLILWYCIPKAFQFLPYGSSALSFLITINKFLECLCNHIGIFALEKYKILGWFRDLILLYSEIDIVFPCDTLKGFNIAIRNLNGLCTLSLIFPWEGSLCFWCSRYIFIAFCKMLAVSLEVLIARAMVFCVVSSCTVYLLPYLQRLDSGWNQQPV